MPGEISIKLQGGLGNYLFQIACAYAYGLRYGKEPIFNMGEAVRIHKFIDTYGDNILRNIKFVSSRNLSNLSIFNENGFHYNEIPKIENNVYLNGYFQSEKYFKDYEKEIRDLFSFKDEHRNAIMLKYAGFLEKNTCSIHIRRGDYLNSPNHHPVITINYIMKAVRQMPEDSLFLVFSDDMDWCLKNLPDIPDKFIFIDGNKDYDDLLLMSLCKNNIICNSTFSWWAAWLNSNTDKKVIAPSKWFGPAYANYDLKDLYPKEWEKI